MKSELTFALMGHGRGALFNPPPPTPFFFQIARKRQRAALQVLAHLMIHLFRICCRNFRPRSRKVRSPVHVK